ncbi:1-(5-phosphoribosyl)-5-[(5-phosphoribosylamino)methylideneamino] imidazole-4-carboxamide isomerase [Drechslerella dactyloides]|uniref:1-(5-phosphoribosyl)-5-[(5-phosphoribosylamino)methylideneamino] imidazole-4-carboxamide isomerase n=1 Tax=Drechslerella dactyloides TaxID=74499 RepID=A0AAD6NMV2_DREDA|nr:1-(5-phosphoribosyl)-5-[(5-phosphoribosylamino)methylideneamino] imidazole-4-carboxamide isomerase [Drechslerella dactyloides]
MASYAFRTQIATVSTGKKYTAMTKFRPCIDIHAGVVKQIVGGTLFDAPPSDSSAPPLVTNHTSALPPSHFAALYKQHNLTGAHVIMLGPNCEAAAREALDAWPGGMQVGGGINASNAAQWLERGADKVIVTSYLFPDGKFSLDRLRELSVAVGKDKLVVDVSCRRRDDRWFVATNKWQTITDTEVTEDTLSLLSEYCSEFLIHAADVEGLCNGIDEDLVRALGKWSRIPTTYAGGGKDIADLDLVRNISGGRADLTFGSALDIFGGDKVRFEDCVSWNKSYEG